MPCSARMGLTCSRISAWGLGEAPTFSTVVSVEAASDEAAEEAEEAVLEPQAARLAARASASTDATIFFMLCHSSYFINRFALGLLWVPFCRRGSLRKSSLFSPGRGGPCTARVPARENHGNWFSGCAYPPCWPDGRTPSGSGTPPRSPEAARRTSRSADNAGSRSGRRCCPGRPHPSRR